MTGTALCIKDQEDHVIIADLISGHEDTCEPLFKQVLWHCDIDDHREELKTEARQPEAGAETDPSFG